MDSDNMAFHSTYNDYLIHKTKQKSSLRNNILDPNLNLRQNLPLYINYQVSELRRKKSKVDYNCLHSNLAQKIEIITENSLLKEKTNFTKLDNFLPSASRKKLINIKTTPLHDDTTKGLYDKLCKKDNKSTNYIDKYFTFQTEDVISHKKIDTKEKIGLEKNLKMIMHDAISEKLLNNLFKKFSCLQLKKNISEEKKQNKLIEGEVDFENRFETLYKKLQINKKENEKTLNELCLLENMDMAKILDLPQAVINEDFIKRYSSAPKKKEALKPVNNSPDKIKRKPAKIFESDYFKELFKEPEFFFDPDAEPLEISKKKPCSLDLKRLFPIQPKSLKIKTNSVALTNRSRLPQSYSSSCKKHVSSIDMLCNTARYNESNTRDKFRNFLSECQDETSSFHQTKELYEKKIIKAQTKMDLAYGKLKNKEKSKKAGLSNNFKEFIKQRDFKRKLINSLLSGSTEAEKKYTLIAFKQKRV